MKIYIDTNVYLDYLLDRKKSMHAFKIFSRTLKCRYHIIVSDHLLTELDKYLKLRDSRILFEFIKHKIILIKTRPEDIAEAKILPTHYADALHIVLAKKSGAEYIVTNNIKDFISIFKTDRPENF